MPREICSGSCETHESSYMKLKGMIIGNKVCRCCTAETTYTETVKMICNGSKVDAEYVRIAKCKCEMCGKPPKNSDLE